MTQPNAEAESMLVLELGPLNIRAMLFDAVAGRYRYLGAGQEKNTGGAPYFSVIEGALRAIRRLQEITGRELLDHDAELIQPSDPNGRGIDQVAIIFSGEPQLRIAVYGLLEEVSLGSLKRLALSLPGGIVSEFSLDDRRTAEEQLDSFLQAKPDLVFVGGGSENGAEEAVARLVDHLWLALQVLPADERPVILYTGNQVLDERIEISLDALTRVYTTTNVRPTPEQEDLGPAQEKAARAVGKIAEAKLPGLRALSEVCRAQPIPAGFAFGRMIRLLSMLPDRSTPILGVHMDAAGVILASASRGRVNLLHHPTGFGPGALDYQTGRPVEEIIRWISADLQPEVVRDHLLNRALYPHAVPATDEALWIELAAARTGLAQAYTQLCAAWPAQPEVYEPVVVSGQWFSQLFTPAQGLHLLLDGLQPTGITTVMLDAHGILPAIGAAAELNNMLPVQLIDSSAFIRLGTIIAPVSPVKQGTPILELRLENEQGTEMSEVIHQGSLTVLPLPAGQSATLHFKPLRKVQFDPRNPKAHVFRVKGGHLGIVIDARGRPLNLPRETARRRELLGHWESTLLNYSTT